MAKYYAVRVGRNKGIYKTWAECEAQVKGFSNAVYKKFSTYEEAINFIEDNDERLEDKDIKELGTNEMVAYIDGSFNEETKTYSFGAVIFTVEGKETCSKKERDLNLVDMRNVAGEIAGAKYSMEEAIKRGKDTLYLHYDYMGIEKWATGEWKANKYGTKEYKKYYDSIKDRLKVVFIKIKAHSGNQYNEEADMLAKKALDI
ncbi:ribonuclease H1 domain-containing protein [Tepidimicrobium xylanilyticum]|uniref:ribonuclease H n=1 Tax=Tepidimicrobium xylanilyticum TaxID=1123352 RepID=A0A1H2XJV5_9FIRM|nr:ribonuclease H family protein [Tepidimicrobium xylanilyticum]GMG97524.1 RNase H [Tepidimicrobium xylanilyticum]SDW93110.1 ribonuclease HI [Tepidimicrobium xylanilyticum]